ncbi:MAG: competence protein CoiA family protein, partial [Lysinibacillus sp.]
LLMLTKSMDADRLKSLRQQQSFYCPQCLAPLTLKVGRIKIPHFAHLKNSTCEQSFSEGETYMHVLGKQQLYSFLQERNITTKLEYPLKMISQRPDLFVEYHGKRYAIEFQYSPIAPDIFLQRTEGYRSVNINPLWLVQTPKTIDKNFVQKQSVSQFYRLFIEQYKGRSFILSYCPKRKSFYYISLLFHVHKNTYITVVDQLPIELQIFPFYMPKPMQYERFVDSYYLHKKSILTYLENTLKYSKQGAQNLFMRYMYELRLGLFELPPFLRMPIKGSEAMGVVASGWQCALFYFAQKLEKTVWELKMSEVQLFFTCMKLPFNIQTVEVLRSYVRICRSLHIHSHRVAVDEKQLVHILYSQYVE